MALENNEVFKNSSNTGSRVTLEEVKSGRQVDYFIIIMKSPFIFSDRQFCILAHEAIHVCQFFLPQVLNIEKEVENYIKEIKNDKENLSSLTQGAIGNIIGYSDENFEHFFMNIDNNYLIILRVLIKYCI